jgi:hypothetical protein
MLRAVIWALIASAAVCVSNPARAQDDYYRVGCYLGLAGTVAIPASLEDDVDDSLGLHARAGCRGAWAGGELHFEWLEGFDTNVAGSDDVDAWALTLDGKLYPLAAIESRLPPLAKRFQPFATVGFGYLDFGGFVDDWDFAGRFGGGLDVYLTRNIALSIDTTYVLPVSNDQDNLDYVSVGWGLLYRF